MKKTGKRLIALLAILPLIFSLSGCMMLDDLRSRHAFWQGEDEILWGDAVYKELVYHSDLLYVETTYDEVHVTEPDVPVLLSPGGFLFYPTEDKLFLSNGYSTYCREDRYQEIQTRMMRPFHPDIVCYFYTTYNPADHKSTDRHYILTEKQQSMITTVLENVEPEVMREGWTMQYDQRLALWECSSDLLLRREAPELIRAGNTYYLRVFENGQYLYFAVPEELRKVCNSIMYEYDHRFDQPTEDTENDL